MIKKKLLVVDDEEIVRISCQRVFVLEGHDVTLCSNAKEALLLLEADTFDLVLLDLMMPEVDGFELTLLIKKRWPGMKVVLMTGYITAKVKFQAESVGVDYFIEKPFLPEDILAAVQI
ncbi:MAG: response regulator [Nitrospirae bacterium]|nr:response regulator [Nitrospirota bacterium]